MREAEGHEDSPSLQVLGQGFDPRAVALPDELFEHRAMAGDFIGVPAPSSSNR